MQRKYALALIAIVCLSAVLAKVALLMTSQSSLDADEAIVGLMALHIQQGIDHPVFFYGQSYDAGAGLLAHAAAILFRFGGVFAISLKVVALMIWIGTAAIATGIVRKWLGWHAAGLTAALILWAPTSVEWAMKARGGHMLAVAFMLLTIGLALRLQTGGQALALGLCGGLAAWAQPSVLPAVALVLGWLGIQFLLERRFALATFIAAGPIAVSLIFLAALRSANSTWSWQAFAGSELSRDPLLLLGRVLPGIFTPNLDWSVPPSPPWVTAVAYVWLVAAAITWLALVVALYKNRLPEHLRRPAVLFLVVVCAAAGSMFIVDSQYVSSRVLLPLYPLACMTLAAGTEVLSKWSGRPWPFALVIVLVVSGIAVHAASLGPATIHGAGEQQRRLPAQIVDAMVADLDRHQVPCVFSESPMLQWNLIFASRERIAARWILARDRWQPYVERVDRAYLAGQPCALLVRAEAGDQRIGTLRAYFGEKSDRFTLFSERYALLYNPPAAMITGVFKLD